MERVEKYVEGICRHMKGTEEDLQNLREEVKAHLYESIEELKEQGFTEGESIALAIERFGDQNKIEKELSKEFRKKNKKTPFYILGVIVALLIVSTLVFESYYVAQWSKGLIAPNGIIIREGDSNLIEGSIVFEGQQSIYDDEVINKIVSLIQNSKYKRFCSKKESYNIKIQDRKYLIGTVWTPVTLDGGITTVDIFKDGSFIASKQINFKKWLNMKGKLSKKDLEYIDSIYKAPPIIK